MQIQTIFNPCECDPTLTLQTFYEGNSRQDFNFETERMNGRLKGIKSIFIDNIENSQPFEFTVSDTGQRIFCPAYSQGYFEILTDKAIFTAKTIGLNSVTVPLLFLTYPIFTSVWSK